jgi:hypothetical protein
MIKTFVTAATLGAAVFFSTPERSEAASVGIAPTGITTVAVTADLTGLGLGGAPVGTASAVGGVFSFPITGGTIDTVTGNALIEHDGSGVQLFALADPMVNVSVGNFLIDTMMGKVFGDVLGSPTNLALFDLGPASGGDIPLLISADLAGALKSIFALDEEIDLTGVEFGLANTFPTPVPVPAALPLLLAGLGGLALLRRKRAA